MEVEIAANLVKVIVENLIKISNEKITRIPGLETNAQELSQTLETVKKLLEGVEAMKAPDKEVKGWLKNLEDVVFNADNVLDELNYHHHLGQIMSAPEPPTKPNRLACCFFSSYSHHPNETGKDPRVLEDVNKELKSVNDEATRLDLINRVPVDEFDAPNPGFRYRDPEFFVGRKEEVVKLVGMLTNNPTTTLFFFIHAVQGMGGMGKSALIWEVYNHESVKARFGRSRIWIKVSAHFNPDTVLKTLLYRLGGGSNLHIERMDMEEVLEKLHEALEDTTYLLVLDDVWNEDGIKWECFMNSLLRVTSTRGNHIVISTRSEKVASITNAFHIHPLKPLSDEDCWSIIKENIFLKGTNDSMPFETAGKSIARRCCGLPLAANVVNQLLYAASNDRYSSSNGKWDAVGRNWLSKDEGRIITGALRMSYDNLSLPFKKCFAYCSIFSEGHPISKQTIIDCWKAEGFLQSEETDDMEIIGEQFFSHLIHSSLLLVAMKDDDGTVESCVMHGLMRDFASSVLGSSDVNNHVRYLIHVDDDDGSSPIPVEKARHLRTLIFRGEIADDSMFLSFKSIRFLTLDCERVMQLPSSVHALIHLRNLNISKTQIQYLPDWIGELHYLKTLNAFTESLRELPRTSTNLVSLRHLYIPSHVELPPGIGAFSNLRELKFRVGEQKGFGIEEIGGLSHLRELHIHNMEKVHDCSEASEAKLFEKQTLIVLHLEWSMNREGETNDESILKDLDPHENLEKLKITGFNGKSFPLIRKYNNLVEFTLSKCKECNKIPMLALLPNLKYLYLSSIWNVKLLDSLFCLDEYSWSENTVLFPALESMSLSNMPELMQWTDSDQMNAFPQLKSLKIKYCKKLEGLPTWLFSRATHLTKIEITDCYNLRELPNGIQALTCLESVTIKGCQNLKSMVYEFGTFTCLRSLKVHDCQRLKQIVDYSQAPLLQKVYIAELQSLENLPWFIDCLAGATLLEELTIVGIPHFRFSSSEGNRNLAFCKLRKLEMDVSRDEWSGESSDAIMETVDGILKQCCLSLTELNLTGLGAWKCLPRSILHLHRLESLQLENFDVEELPKDLGRLPYMKTLSLSNFTKLKHLPSIKYLEKLSIRDCPELRVEYEGYHVPDIDSLQINGHPVYISTS